MIGIAATGGGAAGVVQAVPLIVPYLIAVGVAVIAIWKLTEGSLPWHKILAIFTFILGGFITVAIPELVSYLNPLGSAKDRMGVVVPMVLLTLVMLIVTFVQNKGRIGGGKGKE